MALCIENEGEVVGQVSTQESDWYAIIKEIKNGKSKLFTMGDIIYSESDITKCLRILKIRNSTMLLEDLETAKVFILTPGERIPLKDLDKVFERTIKASILEYQYLPPEEFLKDHSEDFTVRESDSRKVILTKGYKKTQAKDLSDEEKALFDLPMKKQNDERLEARNFMDINFDKIGENDWVIDRSSAASAAENVEKALFSIILSTQPRFRLKEGPSLNFTSELGDVTLNREGFVIRNLAIAKLGERSGIKEGDIIKRVNGQSVNSLLGIYRAYVEVRQKSGPRIVKIEVVREGRPVILTYRIR